MQESGQEVHTFLVDAQQGTCHLPFPKDTALAEPPSRTPVLTTACDVMIYGRI
jgi:hypothetical protein